MISYFINISRLFKNAREFINIDNDLEVFSTFNVIEETDRKQGQW